MSKIQSLLLLLDLLYSLEDFLGLVKFLRPFSIFKILLINKSLSFKINESWPLNHALSFFLASDWSVESLRIEAT